MQIDKNGFDKLGNKNEIGLVMGKTLRPSRHVTHHKKNGPASKKKTKV